VSPETAMLSVFITEGNRKIAPSNGVIDLRAPDRTLMLPAHAGVYGLVATHSLHGGPDDASLGGALGPHSRSSTGIAQPLGSPRCAATFQTVGDSERNVRGVTRVGNSEEYGLTLVSR